MIAGGGLKSLRTATAKDRCRPHPEIFSSVGRNPHGSRTDFAVQPEKLSLAHSKQCGMASPAHRPSLPSPRRSIVRSVATGSMVLATGIIFDQGSGDHLCGEKVIGDAIGLGRSATKRLIEAAAFPTTHVGGLTMARRADITAWLDAGRPAEGSSPAATDNSASALLTWADDGGPEPRSQTVQFRSGKSEHHRRTDK